MITTTPRAKAGKPGPAAAPADRENCAAVWVAEPLHLASIQQMTRTLCRAVEMDEAEAVQTILAVSEFTEQLYISPKRLGRMELSLLRHKGKLRLELRADL